MERKEQDRYSRTTTAEEFFEDIDFKIKELEIADKYTGSSHEKQISRYQFVEDTVKSFGISDSYVAQCLYHELKGYSGKEYKTEEGMPWIIKTLEMYRCVVKKSMGTKDRLLEEYSPWNK